MKKYWSNLKQQSKNVLTVERQSRFLTGGGPQENIAEVDPNVIDIVPDLMTTAPTISSSNFSTQESAGILPKQHTYPKSGHVSSFRHLLDTISKRCRKDVICPDFGHICCLGI